MVSSALYFSLGALCLSSLPLVDGRESFRGQGASQSVLQEGGRSDIIERAANLSFLDAAVDANASANASAASAAVAQLHVGLRQVWDKCVDSDEFGNYGKEGANELLECVSQMKIFRGMANDHLVASIGANDQYRTELDKTQKILQDIVHQNQILKDAVRTDHENALASLGFTVACINQRIEGIKKGGTGIVASSCGDDGAGKANLESQNDDNLGAAITDAWATDGRPKSLTEQRAVTKSREMTVQASGRQRGERDRHLLSQSARAHPRAHHQRGGQ